MAPIFRAFDVAIPLVAIRINALAIPLLGYGALGYDMDLVEETVMRMVRR